MPDNVVDLSQSVKLPDPAEINRVGRALLGYADSEDKAAGSARSAAGPFERLAKAREALAKATTAGMTGDRMRDLGYAQSQAQKRVDKITGGSSSPDFGSRFATLIKSSRFGGGGSGGGMMPLVGKAMDLFGGAGASEALLSNPYTAAAAAAIAAAKAIYEMTAAAAEAGRAFSASRFATGATSGEAAKLAVYSSAFGADFGGMAKTLNERITTDPTARAFGSRLGVYNVAGPYGKVDTAGQLLKAVEGLRAITNREERIRVAQTLGIEGALPLTQVSKGTLANLKGDAATTERIMNPDFERKSAEFMAAQARVKGGWDAMTAALGENFMPMITDLMNNIADIEYGWAAFAKGDLKGAFGHYKNTLKSGFGFTNKLGDMSNPVKGAFDFGGKARDQWDNKGGAEADSGDSSEMNSNTEQLKKVGLALAALTEIIGGGDRARTALPSGLDGYALTRGVETGALRFGTL